MSCLPFFRLAVELDVLVVVLFHLRCVDLELRGDGVRRQRDIFELHFLGHLERGLIGVVECFHRGVIDLDLLQKGIHVEGGDRDLALLVKKPKIAFHVGLCQDIGARNRFLQRAQDEILTHALLEHQWRHVLALQQLLIARS